MSTKVVKFHLHPYIFRYMLLCFLLCVDFISTQQISFKYTNFENETAKESYNECPDPMRKICLYGDAYLYGRDIDLDYLGGTADHWGAAVYSEQIPFHNKQTNQTTSFSSEFFFTLHCTSSGILAFFISGFPFQPSSGYLGLDYGSSNFIAVDLDRETDGLGQDEIQLGLHLNSEDRVKFEIIPERMRYESYYDGRVVVDYDSVNFNLSVYFEGKYSSNARFFHVIDLNTILPENVSIGFIATSHQTVDKHRLTAWNFSSTFPIIEGHPTDPPKDESKTDDFMPSIEKISFKYNNFQNETVKESDDECPDPVRKICLYGDAIYENGGLDVDYRGLDNWGAAAYSDEIQFQNKQTNQAASFTSEFTFTIQYTSINNASGTLAFFMSSFPFQHSSGYLGLEHGGNSNFITVDLDKESHLLYSDQFQLGLHLNSRNLVEHKIILISKRSVLDNNYEGRIVVDYDSINFNLSISFNDIYSSQFVGFNYMVDLSTILSENVSIGFVSTSNQKYDEHIITAWNFSSTFPIIKEELADTSRSKWLAGGVVFGILSLMSLLGLTLFFWKLKMKNQVEGQEVGGNKETEEDWILDAEFEDDQQGPRKISYHELQKATDNFSSKRKLGEGGFGPVYSGFLQHQNVNVAIKRISGHSKQGRKEYIAEVKIISQLRHKNMVQLIGWCHENGQFLLVYELMENGSLDSFIFDHTKSLSWPLRYKISKGLASALIYLHQEWKQCVVHRDVKAGNIMLEKSFNAKLGDFGLARFSNHGGGVQTTLMAGTMGYMAPECFITGKGSKESDVYAFGIVSLEIVCGRKCIDHNTDESKVKLVEWVWKMYGCGRILDVVDERILNDDDYNEQQVKQLLMVGLCCAHPDLQQRPTMSHALGILNFESLLPNLPMEMPQHGSITTRPQSIVSYTTDTTSTSTTSFMGTVELSNIR